MSCGYSTLTDRWDRYRLQRAAIAETPDGKGTSLIPVSALRDGVEGPVRTCHYLELGALYDSTQPGYEHGYVDLSEQIPDYALMLSVPPRLRDIIRTGVRPSIEDVRAAYLEWDLEVLGPILPDQNMVCMRTPEAGCFYAPIIRLPAYACYPLWWYDRQHEQKRKASEAREASEAVARVLLGRRGTPA